MVYPYYYTDEKVAASPAVVAATNQAEQASATLALLSNVFEATDQTGGTSVNSEATVPLAMEHIKTGYTHSGNGEVVLDNTGRFRITGRVSVVVASGLDAVGFRAGLQADGGTGFVQMLGTWAEIRLRPQLGVGLSSAGAGTLVFTIVRDLSAGTVLRLRAARSTGSSAVTLQAGGSSLLVEQIG